MRSDTALAPISPKVRWLFWTVFSACYAAVTYVCLMALRRDGSVEVDFVRNMTHPFALFIAGATTWGLCRIAGLPLRSRVESPLEAEQSASTSAELRSYHAQTALRVLAGFYLGIAVLTLPVEFFIRAHFKTASLAWPFFLGVLIVAGMCWLLSHFFRRGKFVARVDEGGVEIQDIERRNKRVHLEWSEIASGVRVENFSVMGSNSHIEFRGAAGKTKAQVFLNLAPVDQQEQFVEVVARYLSLSSAA